MRFGLAHAFLGTLYERLDQYREAMERSTGRHIHMYFVDIAFLQIFMWERFPSLSKPVARVSNEELIFHALRWLGIKKSRNVNEVLDKESEFCFCSYVNEIGNFKVVINYLETDWVVRMARTEGSHQDSYQQMALVFFPGHCLPWSNKP
ncbi:hypothetical protein CFOL_v3_07923 [Cephalotus follicularis]|uniref:Uncharacterized protein n=1 Tax=Cephalotus follicularis TaxID=3775 RepID=A0A1Q3B927_CEPFO|nr:hypothetical protein CFOL_v3_07923 [Cephalotus follicularis]